MTKADDVKKAITMFVKCDWYREKTILNIEAAITNSINHLRLYILDRCYTINAKMSKMYLHFMNRDSRGKA